MAARPAHEPVTLQDAAHTPGVILGDAPTTHSSIVAVSCLEACTTPILWWRAESYRASKAALNTLLKTAATEVKRCIPQLCKPLKGMQIGRAAPAAVRDMLVVLNGLTVTDSFDRYNGEHLPW